MLFFTLDAADESNLWKHRTHPINENLIAKTALGDKEAFTELYLSTKTPVYAFALSILRNAHRAEEVMQDTYIQIFKAAQSYIPEGKPLAWILRITRNLSLMKLREKSNSEIALDEHFAVAYEYDHTDKIIGTVPTTLFALFTCQKSIKFLQKSSKLKRIFI
jgi:RNA polymerase sigma-70 factor (ECF subfamily)